MKMEFEFFNSSTIVGTAMGDQRFCLRWGSYADTLVGAFATLLREGDLVGEFGKDSGKCAEVDANYSLDVTLSADGKSVRAHKILLSACSPYFKELLKVRLLFLSFI